MKKCSICDEHSCFSINDIPYCVLHVPKENVSIKGSGSFIRDEISGVTRYGKDE